MGRFFREFAPENPAKFDFFFRDLPEALFLELKTLYKSDIGQEMTLFNNKEILVGNRPFFLKDWFDSGIVSQFKIFSVKMENFYPFKNSNKNTK